MRCSIRFSKQFAAYSNTAPVISNDTVDTQPQAHGELTNVQETHIHKLPAELMTRVLEMAIDEEKLLKDAMELREVCRRWNSIIESNPTFWRTIRLEETVPRIQKALDRSGSVLLDIDQSRCRHAYRTSLEAIRNVELSNLRSVRAMDTKLIQALLVSAPTSNLVTLNLGWQMDCYELDDGGGEDIDVDLITLFGGYPAPISLKHLTLWDVNIDLAQMALSGLKSLALKDLPDVTSGEIIRAISQSPELEVLKLSWGSDSIWPDVPDTVESHVMTPTPLPLLRRLDFDALPPVFAELLLSAFTFPELRQATIGGRARDMMSLLRVVAQISHLMQALVSIAEAAEDIVIVPEPDQYPGNCVGIAGKLAIAVMGVDEEYPCLDAALDEMAKVVEWMRASLGTRFTAMPIRLLLDEQRLNTYLGMLPTFGDQIRITHLTLKPIGINVRARNLWWRESLTPWLGHSKGSPHNGWILPHLEVLETNVVAHNGNPNIAEIIRKRNAAALADVHGAPKRLREVHLSIAGEYGNHPYVTPDAYFKQTVLEAAGGTIVYWYGYNWTTAEAEPGSESDYESESD